MKLYLLSQDDNHDLYATYSMVVCAESEEDAKTINPDGGVYIEPQLVGKKYFRSYWANKASSISCVEIGISNENQERCVILDSIIAG